MISGASLAKCSQVIRAVVSHRYQFMVFAITLDHNFIITTNTIKSDG